MRNFIYHLGNDEEFAQLIGIIREQSKDTDAIYAQIERALVENRCKTVQCLQGLRHVEGNDEVIGVVIKILSIPSETMKNRIKDIMATQFCENAELLSETKTKMVYSIGFIERMNLEVI